MTQLSDYFRSVPFWDDSVTGNETLLLNFNGTDGSTILTDDTGLNTLTAYGNAQLDTALKKFGTASLLLDGTGDYIDCPYDTSRFDWWTGDYTIDCWVYATSWTDWSIVYSGYPVSLMVGNHDHNALSNYWSFGPITGGALSFYYWNGSAPIHIRSSNSVLATGQWIHIAMVHKDNTIYLFADGKCVDSMVIVDTPTSSASYKLTIGGWYNDYLTGQIDALRITKGTARYVPNFTAPTLEPSA
jgi:hypothetical protein